MTFKPILRNTPTRTRILLACLGLSLAACGDDSRGANPETVQSQLQSTLPPLVDSTLASLDFLQASQAWNELASSISTVQEVSGTGSDAQPLPAANGESPSGQEIADMLVEQIFNADNYEGNGDYAIPASLLCPDIEVWNDSTLEYETLPNQDCLDTVALVEPRVHVQTAGDGLDFDLLIGPQKYDVLALELRSNSIALASDLAEVKVAAEYLAGVLDEEIELPSTMAGVVAASLTAYGPQDAGLAFSIREAVTISGGFPSIGNMSFSSAAADPLVELRVNGAEETMQAALALGRTQLSMPWAAINSDSLATGTFAIDWQGLSATLELSEANANLPFGMLISNVGLGQGSSTAKLDEFTLLSVDLNKDAGRVFDLIMVPGAPDELPVFRFDPGFDLELAFDLRALADAGDEVPAYLVNETYRIEVESGMQPVAGVDEGGLKAVDGAIRIGSSAGASVAASAGECLLASPLESGEHELLGQFSAGPCPL